MQSMVNSYAKLFYDAVARNRDTTSHAVRTGFGQGRMVLANHAPVELMADRVATLDQTVRRLMNRGSGPKLSSMSRREMQLYQ